ncbi:MAG: long-chain fatty acid--CoA ligase [Calditrichaeota bacterium]|nr:MAG: long-chain fatty acid--CoA ligase [Calditrichota bacterium]
MSIQTLSQLFEHNVATFNKPDLLIYRGRDGKFHNLSTNEFKDRVIHCALGLRELGVKQETKLLLLSENRPEWHIVDFACHLLSAVIVPIFPTLVADQIAYIAENSESEFVLVSNQKQLSKIEAIRDELKRVKQIVTFEVAETEGTLPFERLLQLGREQDERGFFPQAVQLAEPDVIATIIYTSGTTGTPKGVMLTHRNFVSNVLDCAQALRLDTSDRGLSFLPLSHAFERTVDYTYFYRGASIVYSASPEMVARDLEESRPTVMASVPRFYEKIKSRVESSVEQQGGLKKKLFSWALDVGRQKGQNFLNQKRDGLALKLKYALADRLVLSKIRGRTGGQLRYFISGGAPLSAEVARFFLSVGLKILEGYGLTETSPVVSVNPYDRPRFGTVGRILPSVQVRIAEDGEVLVKGPNVMLGYYKMPAETKEVLVDGWFHTGDIGMLDEDQYLIITDRKKQLIVTSVGKKVAPQAIEKEVENSRFIEQVVLIGEKRRFISALIVPDFDALWQFAKAQKLQVADSQELVKHPAVLELMQKEVDERQKHFSNYEKIRKFQLLARPLTLEEGYLTPTLKVKRRVVEKAFASLIEEMYAVGEEAHS